MDFEGRTALITGGAGDIGTATARRLSAGGARVATLDLRAAEVEGALGLTGDISRSEDVDAAVRRVESELGHGATFRVTLPIRVEHAADEMAGELAGEMMGTA